MIESKVDKKQRIGRLGEDISSRYLAEKGFSIFTRNYRKKWGEIDIVAEKGGMTYFIEVKSVSCKSIALMDPDGYRPEDNAHPAKLKRLSRVIQSFVLENGVGEWQFDLVTVYIQELGKLAKVERIENIIL